MNDPLDKRLDQLLRDWTTESRPDSNRRAALKSRVLNACHEEVGEERSTELGEHAAIASESVSAPGEVVGQRLPSVSWWSVGTIAVSFAAVLVVGIVLTWRLLNQNIVRDVAHKDPPSASGSAVSDAVADGSVADVDTPSAVRETDVPGPSLPAAEAFPPSVIDAEIPQAEEDGPTDNPPPSVAADVADGGSKKMRDGFAEQAEADSAEQTDRPRIHAVVARHDLAEVRRLLQQDASLAQATDSTGATALHVAASIGAKEIAKLLIANGADVNARTNEGQTPLDLAKQGPPVIEGDAVPDRSGHGETVELLRKHGGQPGGKRKRSAAKPVREEVEAEMEEAGADPA